MYQVPVATKDDVDAAVANARKAFKDWAKTSFAERAGLLVQYANMIHANRGPLEELLVKEQGKPLGFAHMEVDLGVCELLLRWRSRTNFWMTMTSDPSRKLFLH